MATDELLELKSQLRRKAYDAQRETKQGRGQQSGDGEARRSRRISEAQTVRGTSIVARSCGRGTALPVALNGDKRIVVPSWTTDEHGANKLGLWPLDRSRKWSSASGTFSTRPATAERAGKSHRAEELDRDGPRRRFRPPRWADGERPGVLRPAAAERAAQLQAVAPCYESQLTDEIAMGPHDVYMDKVVTEVESTPARDEA